MREILFEKHFFFFAKCFEGCDENKVVGALPTLLPVVLASL